MFEGEIEGEGMMFFVQGDQYLGKKLNIMQRSICGVVAIISITIMLGYWRRGHMEGKGVYRYRFGDTYEGSFLNGYPYGEGKYQYRDGGYYLGEYRNLIHQHRLTALEGTQRLPKCDGWRHGFGVVSK